MKRVLLSALLLTSSYFSYGQVVCNVLEPADIAGNLNITYAEPGSWGVGDPLDPANSVTDTLMLVDDGSTADSLGCLTLVNNVAGKIAVVYRGDCQFGVKAFMAESAGAVAVIIINNVPGDPIGMNGGTDGPNVTIPVVMISQLDGALLRSRLNANEVIVAFIGNKNGLFATDLSIREARMLIPSPIAKHSLLTQNSGEYTFRIGTWVYNDGTSDQSASSLSASVSYAGNTLYSEVLDNLMIPTNDSVYVEFPVFTSTAYLSGKYTLTYDLKADDTDEFDADNLRIVDFFVSDYVHSYVQLDAAGLPISSTGYRPSAATSTFSACIHFRDANAARTKTEGLYFAATTNADAELNGQEFVINAYKWNNVFTDLNDAAAAIDQLEEVGTGLYQYTEDSMDFKTVYAKFDQSFDLESNQRYLFCVTTYDPNTYIGYGSNDYSWVIDTVLQPLFPIQTDAGYGILGFGGEPSAIGIQLTTSTPTPVITATGYTNICDGETVTLTSSSADGNVWSTGEGTRSIQVSQSGTYTVSVAGKVSNTIEVVVNSYPTKPVITATSRVICPGSDVTLTSSATGNEWSTGATTAAITVSNSGIYTVTASNGGCKSTSEPVKVTNFAVPTVTASKTEFCTGEKVTLTSSSATGNTWSGGQTTQSIQVSTANTYTVSVAGDGCTATSAPMTITANDPEVLGLTNVTQPSACATADGSFEVTGTSLGDLSYTYDGTTTVLAGVQLPYVHSSAAAGSYTINFVNDKGCSSVPVKTTINDPGATSPTLTMTGTETFCAGDSLILTSSSAVDNVWSNGATTESITIKTAGIYSVTVNTAGCSAGSDPVTVVVNALPTGVSAGVDMEICTGEEVILMGTGTVSYAWTNGATNGVAFVPTVSGEYVVTGTDFNNCSNTDTMILTIHALPTVDAGTDAKTCIGKSITLNGAGADTYTWSNGVINGAPFVAIATQTYTVTGTTVNGCSNTDDITITVNALPNVTYVETVDTTCFYHPVVLSPGTPALGQYSGAGVTNSVSGATFDPKDLPSGAYTIIYTATDANGCQGSAAQSIVVDGCISVEELENYNIAIYPNPANQTFTVSSDKLMKFNTINLTDQLGRVIESWTINSTFLSLDVANVAAGNYNLVFKGTNGRAIEKVQINH